ncbi:unnamed protein product [Rotaria magnacalcarata]|uniref:Uncharacterized protein n=1 Tax=Rotaria magnacalcarata TaxID=392030 RepID=A0A815WZ26_9BILA|nr:unnamed protein product [Rotaria magnacalcarata]CAF2208526.1 unnamed protein product [Rotaria magnacalcarata]CAF4295183.1 unnamed protein product [Rotaria magnacalcarata]CAF5191653.1 unnamed protein product [Rotaria magnacalcarata]
MWVELDAIKEHDVCTGNVAMVVVSYWKLIETHSRIAYGFRRPDIGGSSQESDFRIRCWIPQPGNPMKSCGSIGSDKILSIWDSADQQHQLEQSLLKKTLIQELKSSVKTVSESVCCF